MKNESLVLFPHFILNNLSFVSQKKQKKLTSEMRMMMIVMTARTKMMSLD